jgi:hypothetical protein
MTIYLKKTKFIISFVFFLFYATIKAVIRRKVMNKNEILKKAMEIVQDMMGVINNG